jgi:TPR repeat protein/DNA-binding Lrp family transcriptional regulator
VVLEHTYDYSKPFYQFFQVITLEGLTRNETINLLLKLGEHYKQERIESIIQQEPVRVEALRRLTGGVPRTIILLFEIFVDHEKGDAFQDLEFILDRVTPPYENRMDDLSPWQQKIVDAIALNWDAMTTKEIAEKIRMESKAVSSQLKQLEKNRIIHKIKTSTKNHLYQVTERFFNIWYLMRYGRRRGTKRIQWLVRFLESWCSESELGERVRKHIHALEKETLYPKYALYFTEALAGTKIPKQLQHALITHTREFLNKKDKSLINELSKSDIELLGEGMKYYEKGEFKKSLYCLEDIQNKSDRVLFYIALISGNEFKNFKKAEKYYLLAVEKGASDAMYNLAWLYATEFKDFKKAEKYYLQAVEKGTPDAMYNLAWLYAIEFKDFKKAEKYYLQAVEKGTPDAMYNLAWLYAIEFKDFKKAEEYYLLAVEKGAPDAMYNLAWLYATEFKDFKKAEEYYLLSVEKGDPDAIYNLAWLYENELKDSKKAEGYYIQAIEKGNPDAMNNLARLYFQLKRHKTKALELIKEALTKKDNIKYSHNLSVILLWNNEIAASLKMENELMENEEYIERYITTDNEYLILLMAKKQYYAALKMLNENPFDLKERIKPLYYALMYFLQDDFPNEYKKMGEELKQTVEEIINKVKQWEKDYK